VCRHLPSGTHLPGFLFLKFLSDDIIEQSGKLFEMAHVASWTAMGGGCDD
jgi:hypothetical protein